jgi:aryl-alcohol dehydrogenase-like predicted oxidoreductase
MTSKAAPTEATDKLIRLGRSDLLVSPMGVGTGAWGKNQLINLFGSTDSPQDEEDAFQASLANGVMLFDTAAGYKGGNSEIRVGEVARASSAIIGTKLTPRSRMVPFGHGSCDYLLRALDKSLQRLGRDGVDLYQIHMPPPFADIRPLMNRMADAVEAGKIRAVGISNFTAPMMREAHAVLQERGIPLASHQIQYSLVYRRPEFNGVLEACRELEVTPIAYMPMAMGLLTGKYRPGVRPNDWVRSLTGVFGEKEIASAIAITARLREVGDRHGKTPAQVALRWVIDKGAIPIPGAKNASQATANAGALTFALTPDEMDYLADATRAWIQGPKWKFGPALRKD